MAFSYDTVVPWGRSFEEYLGMFSLKEHDLKLRMLGCADGPASFNAEMFKRGGSVVSCDPLYALPPDQIEARINETNEGVIRQTRENQDQFNWRSIRSIEELGRVRMSAMKTFLADYSSRTSAARYVAGAFPDLPFADATFDIALCSHFLFFYSDHLSLEFHQQAILEMCRVAAEARVFPLLNYNSQPSPFVAQVHKVLIQAGYTVFVETVPYEFQRGANQMLRVSRTI
jgi:SAM-dependent methyltransferase